MARCCGTVYRRRSVKEPPGSESTMAMAASDMSNNRVQNQSLFRAQLFCARCFVREIDVVGNGMAQRQAPAMWWTGAHRQLKTLVDVIVVARRHHKITI